MSSGHDDPGTLLRTYVAAGDSADLGRMEICLAERIVTHSPGGTEIVGIEAQRDAWAAAHEGLGDLKHEIQTLLVDGEHAVARIVVTGIHMGVFLGIPATGVTIRVDQALFVRAESGRITEMWEVVDTGTGLRQLGVLGDQPLSPGT